VKIILAVVLSLYVATCFSQRITPRDLMGTWLIEDSIGFKSGEMFFVDSRTFTFAPGGVANSTRGYTLKPSALDFTIFTISMNVNNKEKPIAKFLLKKVDNDRFKMQGTLTGKHTRHWELPETRHNTWFLVREK
jgi:hypothetical protein